MTDGSSIDMQWKKDALGRLTGLYYLAILIQWLMLFKRREKGEESERKCPMNRRKMDEDGRDCGKRVIGV